MKDLNKADIEAIILSESWEVRATLRAMVRRSLYLTAKMLVSYNEPRNTMTAEVFKERQDWLQWIVCEKKRGLLEDPRSYVKTTGSTRTIPVWCSIQRGDDRYDHPNELARIDAFLMQHPHLKGTDMRLAIAGDTKKAATRFTGAVRRFYLTNPFFRFLFPELNWENPLRTDYGSFNDEEMYLPGRLQPELPGAFLTAFGTETAIVGGRLDGLIVSDLVGDHNWRSSGEMNRLRDWLKTAPALLSHRDPRQPYGGFVLVEENRWTLDDVNSLIHNEYTEWDIWRRGVFRCYVHGVGNCGRWGSDETKDCAPTEQSLWPEGPYRDAEALARLRQEEGEAIFCNPGEAPILMSDWTQRRLDEVKVGDEVVGFEPVATGKRAKLVKATVLAVGSRVAPVVKVTFSDGSVIRCTPEHKFYTGRLPDKGSSQTARKLYDVPRAGRRFVRVVNDWLNETDNSEWHYLAGILDGEGSLKHTNITITQVEEVNGCVVERIDRCLSALKIPHLRKKYKRTDDKTWRNGQNVPLTWVLNSDRDFMSRLLTRTAIGKKQQIVDRMWKHPGRLGLRKEGQQNGRIKVTSIEPAGVERVYALCTTSGNYVVWGIASSNSAQRLNDPTQASELKVDKIRDFKLDICPVTTNGRTNREWCVLLNGEGGEEVLPLSQLEPHIISIDPATSQEATSARTSISWFAYDRPTRRRFTISVRADRFGPDESVWQVMDMLDEMDEKIPGKVRKMVIEKVAAQSYMAVAIKHAAGMTRDGVRKKRRTLPPIEMIPPAKGTSKLDRIKRRVGNVIGQGLLYVRAGLQLPLHEVRHFPSGTLDWLDTLAQAEEVFLNQSDGGIDAQTAARRAHRALRLATSGVTGTGI